MSDYFLTYLWTWMECFSAILLFDASIEAEKQQAEIDEMLSAGEFDAASLIQSVLSRADTQYLCCTAGKADPMTLRIKEALAAAPPCDTFDTKLYHAIADKIVLHRTTPIQLKLINGMVV